MTGRVEGKVALVTGAARGQGRSHAVRLAREGADVVAVDVCGPVPAARMYEPATRADLDETVRQVEALGRRIVPAVADVRDRPELTAAVDAAVAELGRLDIVCANAGVFAIAPALDIADDDFREVLDVNVTGVWNTCRAALPHLLDRGGSIVITSSTAGIKGLGGAAHYTASKHAVVGLMRTLANEFADANVRVNTVHPTAVDTGMIQNETTWRRFLPGVEAPTRDQAGKVLESRHPLAVPWVEPEDVSNAVLWLASDEARYVTGVLLPVDAGFTIR